MATFSAVEWVLRTRRAKSRRESQLSTVREKEGSRVYEEGKDGAGRRWGWEAGERQLVGGGSGPVSCAV